MLDAARQALTFCRDRKRSDLDDDPMLRRALVNCIQEIGEAASKTTGPARARVAGVPWQKLIGTRHRLVHDYAGINLDLLWQVVEQELPSLIEGLETALAAWPSS